MNIEPMQIGETIQIHCMECHAVYGLTLKGAENVEAEYDAFIPEYCPSCGSKETEEI